MKQHKQFGKWTVYRDGTMDYDNGRYDIAADRLTEEDWIYHLHSKGWIDWNEFIPAYFQALAIQGVRELKIRIGFEGNCEEFDLPDWITNPKRKYL
jgi:hypothetical protein